MKVSDATNGARHDDPQAFPWFELEYLVDDIDNPSEVMIVPHGAGDRPRSEWILAEIRDAVPLEWVR